MTHDDIRLNSDEVLEILARRVESASSRFLNSINKFVAEAPQLTRQVVDELELVKDPKAAHIEFFVLLATELTGTVQLVNDLLFDAASTFISVQKALSEHAKALLESIQQAREMALSEAFDLLKILTTLADLLGIGTGSDSGDSLQHLITSGELDRRLASEPVTQLRARLECNTSDVDALREEASERIRERMMVVSAIRALVYEHLADILERRLDLFRAFLGNLEVTRGGTEEFEGNVIKAGIAAVIEESAIAVTQEYLVRVVPAVLTGGFPLISALFAGTSAAHSVAEKRRQAKGIAELQRRYRSAHDERGTVEDAFDFKEAYDEEDERVSVLLRELSDLPSALIQGS